MIDLYLRVLSLVVIYGLLVVVVVLPSIVAFRRGHPNRSAIMALNLLTFWTVVGWVVATYVGLR